MIILLLLASVEREKNQTNFEIRSGICCVQIYKKIEV